MDTAPLQTPAPKVLFAVTEDWYFWSHRKPLARALQSMDCKIVVATRFNAHEARLRAVGFDCIAIPFERSLRHPLRDGIALLRLWSAIRRTRPDIVHLVSLKPILLSALAMFAGPRTQYVAAVTGMGYLFSSADHRARFFQRIAVSILRLMFRRRNTWIIVQNEDDMALLQSRRLASAERRVLIPGVGVDLDEFAYSESPESASPLVVLPARLIRDKGIEDFVAASDILRQIYPAARFVLVGAEDPDNPAALSKRTISAWVDSGKLEWWGHRADMAEVYAQAAIVCLPSYREGFPKVLLEAAACGRALVATDVAGCRDICRDGVNGILVPARDVAALAQAMRRLLDSASTRAAYGAAGRRIAEQEYSVEHIAEQTLAFYKRVRGRPAI